MKAIWNGKVLAESDKTITVEGNFYFPPESITMEFLSESHTKSFCPWKGAAAYKDVVVDGKINTDAAWYYPEPSSLAKHISGYFSFWKGVQVIK